MTTPGECAQLPSYTRARSIRGTESSNPFRSTNQSLAYRTFQRIERNPRVSAHVVSSKYADHCVPRMQSLMLEGIRGRNAA
jgi:hypothetical protein